MMTLFQRLVQAPSRADELISALDPADPKDRREALDALEGLMSEYVVPAADLLAPPEPSTGPNTGFDLGMIAGIEVSDLVASLLASDFPPLQKPPRDPELKRALDRHGIEIETPERRADYFRAWTAERAALLTRRLVNVVKTGHPTGGEEDQREIEKLRRIAALRIPGFQKGVIEMAIDRRMRGPKPRS